MKEQKQPQHEQKRNQQQQKRKQQERKQQGTPQQQQERETKQKTQERTKQNKTRNAAGGKATQPYFSVIYTKVDTCQAQALVASEKAGTWSKA